VTVDDFEGSTRRYQAKSQAFKVAIATINQATFFGRFFGAFLGLFAWAPTSAPWWAIPIFVIVIGWLCGQIYGGQIARREERKMKAEFPEVML
jgi:hypothetical protein